MEYQRQLLILERQGFHLDQLRYLEQRAKHEGQSRLIANGQLPINLPPGFEVGPAQQQPQIVQVNNQTIPTSIVTPVSAQSVIPARDAFSPAQIAVTNVVVSQGATIPPENTGLNKILGFFNFYVFSQTMHILFRNQELFFEEI